MLVPWAATAASPAMRSPTRRTPRAASMRFSSACAAATTTERAAPTMLDPAALRRHVSPALEWTAQGIPPPARRQASDGSQAATAHDPCTGDLGRAWRSPMARSRPCAASTSRSPAGSCLGLLGPNGAGKTTTMRMIMGLTTPSAGAAHRVRRRRPQRSSRAQKARIGLVPQDDNLDPDLSVRQNLEVYGRYFGLPGDRAPSASRRCSPSCSSATRRSAERQPALRRHEAAPRDRPRADQRARARDPRRADHRPRPAGARHDLEAAPVDLKSAARRCCSPPTTWTRRSACATRS